MSKTLDLGEESRFESGFKLLESEKGSMNTSVRLLGKNLQREALLHNPQDLRLSDPRQTGTGVLLKRFSAYR